MGALKLVNKLNQDQRWKFDSHGICIALRDGHPICVYIFDLWTPIQLSEFSTAINGLGANLDLKIIGQSEFILTLKKWAKQNNYNLIKTVNRNAPYEMIYSALDEQFKISVPSGSTKPEQRHLHLHESREEVVGSVVAEKIRVLIVDDSVTIRKILTSIFSSDPNVQVVGALEKPSMVEPFLRSNKVDVMTLDIHMPEMDGVTLLKTIYPKYKIPTIMISSITKEDGPYVLDALEFGAFDYIQKPSFQEIPRIAPTILERVHLAAESGKKGFRKTSGHEFVRKVEDRWQNDRGLIVIGASTGGTEALVTLLKQFPDEIPPVLIVQHIPPVFSKAFADRLNGMFKFSVVEAQDKELIVPNKILIAPGGKQMGVEVHQDKLRVRITDDLPVNRHKPSVDYLFNSVVTCHIKAVVGVILTGMGSDGARGLLELRRQGAKTVVQDEGSSVVYGMPKVALQMGAAEKVAAISEMGRVISQFVEAIKK